MARHSGTRIATERLRRAQQRQRRKTMTSAARWGLLLACAVGAWYACEVAIRSDGLLPRRAKPAPDHPLARLDVTRPPTAAEVEVEDPRAELRRLVESVKWSLPLCREVNRAVTIDYQRALHRMLDNVGQGKYLAADRRLIGALEACGNVPWAAAEATDMFRDEDEARQLMLGMYFVWNSSREQLGLPPVPYGSIPDDARQQFEADRTREEEARRAEREAAIAAAFVWSDDACTTAEDFAEQEVIDEGLQHVTHLVRWRWKDEPREGDDLVMHRDACMRQVYKTWNSVRDARGRAPVPYGQLPDGRVLAKRDEKQTPR